MTVLLGWKTTIIWVVYDYVSRNHSSIKSIERESSMWSWRQSWHSLWRSRYFCAPTCWIGNRNVSIVIIDACARSSERIVQVLKEYQIRVPATIKDNPCTDRAAAGEDRGDDTVECPIYISDFAAGKIVIASNYCHCNNTATNWWYCCRWQQSSPPSNLRSWTTRCHVVIATTNQSQEIMSVLPATLPILCRWCQIGCLIWWCHVETRVSHYEAAADIRRLTVHHCFILYNIT